MATTETKPDHDEERQEPANRHGAWWVRRPSKCREDDCDAEVHQLVFSMLRPLDSTQEIPPNRLTFYGLCSRHVPTEWEAGGVIADPRLVFTVPYGPAKTCTLRRCGGLCGRPETHIAVYLRPNLAQNRLGRACRQCLKAHGLEISDGEIVLEPADELGE